MTAGGAAVDATDAGESVSLGPRTDILHDLENQGSHTSGYQETGKRYRDRYRARPYPRAHAARATRHPRPIHLHTDKRLAAAALGSRAGVAG